MHWYYEIFWPSPSQTVTPHRYVWVQWCWFKKKCYIIYIEMWKANRQQCRIEAWHILRSSIRTTFIWNRLMSQYWYMMTSSNGNIFRVTGPLWGEFTSHRWIALTKSSDQELWCFLWSAPEQTVEQTIETPVIWVCTSDFRRQRIHYDVTVMIGDNITLWSGMADR